MLVFNWSLRELESTESLPEYVVPPHLPFSLQTIKDNKAIKYFL